VIEGGVRIEARTVIGAHVLVDAIRGSAKTATCIERGVARRTILGARVLIQSKCRHRKAMASDFDLRTESTTACAPCYVQIDDDVEIGSARQSTAPDSADLWIQTGTKMITSCRIAHTSSSARIASSCPNGDFRKRAARKIRYSCRSSRSRRHVEIGTR